jgi:hypothetical protein
VPAHTPTLSPRERGRVAADNPFSLGEKVAGASRPDEGAPRSLTIIFVLMRNRGGRGFIDEPTGAKTVEGEGRGERMRFAPGDGAREHVA